MSSQWYWTTLICLSSRVVVVVDLIPSFIMIRKRRLMDLTHSRQFTILQYVCVLLGIVSPSFSLILSTARSEYSFRIMSSFLSAAPSAQPRGAFIVLEGVDRCGKTTQVARLVDRLGQDGSGVTAMRFPDRTTAVGQLINEYLTTTTTSALNDQAIHLLFSANRWEAVATIQEHLSQGRHVVCDRYVHSGVAFSAAKVLVNTTTTTTTTTTTKDDNSSHNNDTTQTPALSMEWCQAADRGLPAPDCIVFLDLSQDQAEQRGGYVVVVCEVHACVGMPSGAYLFSRCSITLIIAYTMIYCIYSYGGERYETRDLQLRVRQRFQQLQDMDTIAWHVIDAAQSMEQVEADIYKVVQDVIAQVQQRQLPLKKMWEEGSYELTTSE
jgi:dTMP kinase